MSARPRKKSGTPRAVGNPKGHLLLDGHATGSCNRLRPSDLLLFTGLGLVIYCFPRARALAHSPHTSNVEGRVTTECGNKAVVRTKRDASRDIWLRLLNRARDQRGARCQHPILAHRLPTQEHSDTGARTTGEKQGPPKDSKGQSRGQINSQPQNGGSWHCGTIHRRIIGESKDIQYGTLKNPSWYQNDQWHLRAYFRSLLLKSGTPRAFADAFLTGLPGRLIHGQVNSTQKRACIHPRTTRTMEQVSNCLSGLVLVSRVSPDPRKGPFQTGSSA
ncbi:hypothetical protein CRG98_020523 [Punica granatum]|uniref:Uncharacterized protein n=1 Tax=Punica granatum TaxID=22663 RepID=A0A2I0JRY3_PUNGR|nr:hypothetical protein CRG98_020523 [Punica granatum]